MYIPLRGETWIQTNVAVCGEIVQGSVLHAMHAASLDYIV